MNLFLSPHSDDETLSGAYTLLRYKPLVLICLEGRRKKQYVPNEVRVAETAAAMEILGCKFAQLPVKCDPPEWDVLEGLLRRLEPDHVWAPLPEENGHEQHNEIGEMAQALWPGKVSLYSTYTDKGRSTHGARVQEEPGWEELKRKALACYVSQASKPDTGFHFTAKDLSEYVMGEQPPVADPGHVRGVKLNLGSGPNPLEGFDNLDKNTGWFFEDGLPVYADGSVEAITVSHALMYVAIDAWPFVFSEFFRVLEPGGVLRITEDSTGDPKSSRQGLRGHGAQVATTPEIVLEHMRDAGFQASRKAPTKTFFADDSLLQQNYGSPPDVFHAEGVKR